MENICDFLVNFAWYKVNAVLSLGSASRAAPCESGRGCGLVAVCATDSWQGLASTRTNQNQRNQKQTNQDRTNKTKKPGRRSHNSVAADASRRKAVACQRGLTSAAAGLRVPARKTEPKTKPKTKMKTTLKMTLTLTTLMALALPVSLQANEDPLGCTYPPAAGNTSQGGLNFYFSQAHVWDTVQLFPALGMVQNACRVLNATGSIWVATGLLTNFLVNATLDPNTLISCPANGLCRPGPYNLLITPDLVGSGQTNASGQSLPVVISPVNPFGHGTAKSMVRAVENGVGAVQTINADSLGDIHTASISIVTPCIQTVTTYAYPGTNTCFAAGSPVSFTSYVTNCGDIQLTNVTVVHSRGATLYSTTPPNLPLSLPLSLAPGAKVAFQGSFTPTAGEIAAGSAADTLTARGTDTTIIGGPNASVTNSITTACNICAAPALPCLTVTKDCGAVMSGQPQTISGVVSNCGGVTITNIALADAVHGSITNIASLAAGASSPYSKTFTAALCGPTISSVTAAGVSVSGDSIQAAATNTCAVTCGPVLSNPTVTNSQLVIVFPTVSGLTNTVQYSDSLLPLNWQPLISVLGDGNPITVQDQATNQARFYRVVVQ